MKNVLTVLAIAILVSGSAYASVVEGFKNSRPDISQPVVPPMPIQPVSPVIIGNLPVVCMKTTGVVANFLERGFKMEELGTNENGTFEKWSGVYEGKKRWAIVMRVSQGLTCKIAGGGEE